MKNKILSIGIAALLALPTSVRAVDIFGNWIADEPIWPGTVENMPIWPRKVETVFSFKVDGMKLTGTVVGPQGEYAIREGKINGDELSFVVIYGALSGNEVKMVYKGKASLNEIAFTRAIPDGMGEPQKFIARREFPRHGDLPLRPISLPVEPSPNR